MKLKIQNSTVKTLAGFCLLISTFCLGHAQPYYVDQSTQFTNIVDSYGNLTISNTSTASPYGATNAPFHNHSTNVVTGESILGAFSKVNSNTVFETEFNVTNYTFIQNLSTFIYNNCVSNTGTGYTFVNDTVTNSILTGCNATNLNITNSTFAGGLEGITTGTGTSGQILTANGAGSYEWTAPGPTFPDITDAGGNVGIGQTSPAYLLDLGGAMQIGFSQGGNGNNLIGDNGSGAVVIADATGFNLDGGDAYTDGNGNWTAQTFIPLSDRTLKENIIALDPTTLLTEALSLTNYTWNFKPHTNVLAQISRRQSLFTTNFTAKVHPASGRQYGPMAQDWHQITGLDDGHHISTTAMQGLLLGGIQGLNQAMVNNSTNGVGSTAALAAAFTAAGVTNTTGKNLRVIGFTGTGVIQSNTVTGLAFRRGNITIPTDIILQSKEILYGSLCSSIGNISF